MNLFAIGLGVAAVALVAWLASDENDETEGDGGAIVTPTPKDPPAATVSDKKPLKRDAKGRIMKGGGDGG